MIDWEIRKEGRKEVPCTSLEVVVVFYSFIGGSEGKLG
jgi:hypothetical protein